MIDIKDMPNGLTADTAIRAYDEAEKFLGIGSPDTDDALMLKPKKVFNPSPPRPIGQIGEFEGLAPQE